MAKSAPMTSAAPWEDSDEAPREGMPDSTKLIKRQRLYRIWIFASLVLCPVLALVAVAGVTKKQQTAEATPATSLQGSPGQAVATNALRLWLTADPAPVPGGQLISWNGASTPTSENADGSSSDSSAPSAAPSGSPTALSTDASGYSVEVDHFTITNNAGALFNSDVQVAIDPRGGQQVVGTPSLIPVTTPVSDNWDNGGPWPGLNSTATPPSAVNDAINTWMDAYISGDPDKLRLAVGDATEGHSYTPLLGVKSATATATYSAAFGGAKSDEMLVQITLNVTWDGQAAPLPGATNVAPGVTYDLLVTKASTAAPVVVAWGGPGTGPDLKPYSNAVASANREPQPTATPSQ